MAKKKAKKTTTKKATKKKTAARKGGRQANKWSVVKFSEIAKFIKDKSVAQTAFSKAVGVTNSTFHNWKNKRCAPDPATQQQIRDVLDGKTVIPEKEPAARSGKTRAPRGAGSQTLAQLEEAGGTKAAVAAPARTTGKKRKTVVANGNGANGSGWRELKLLGEFIRANDGKTADDLHQAVNMVLEVMV